MAADILPEPPNDLGERTQTLVCGVQAMSPLVGWIALRMMSPTAACNELGTN